MFRRTALTTIVLLLFLAGWLGADEPALTPRAGWLLLRNGQVLQGEITRAGDYYVVTLGSNGEVKLPAADVESQVRDLDEAYALKQAMLLGRGAAPHLDLAEWCLRHRLYSKCAEQLLLAMRLEPENPRVVALDRRLQLALEPPKAAVKPATPASNSVGNDEIELAVRQLPLGSLEKFAAVVQPVLLNRCGANQCHGPNAKSEFRLLKPAAGQNANQRFTHRNLYATLQQIDREQPANSRLVTLPQRRHGGTPAAIFDERTKRQLDELIAWTKLASGYVEPVAAKIEHPATLATQAGVLHQPGATGLSELEPSAKATPASEASGKTERPAAASASRRTEAFVPRDEFDAEIFNRQYLKQ